MKKNSRTSNEIDKKIRLLSKHGKRNTIKLKT